VSQEEAIVAAAEWLEARGGSRLDRSVLRRLYGGHQFDSGWRLPVQFAQDLRRLDVLLPTAFPLDLARIALVDRPSFGSWPHIEADGLLCLPRRVTDDSRPIDDLQVALSDAASLVEDASAGRNDDDLRDEFHSYWNPTVTGSRRITSIFDPVGPSRPLAVWRGQVFDVVADSENALRQWLSFRNGTADTRRWTLQQGLFLGLRQPPVPAAYPQNAADVLRLAEANGGADTLVQLSLNPEQNAILVVLGAAGRHGPILAAVGLRRPRIVERRNGFRHVPVDVHVARYFAPGISIERCAVDRADAGWVHGRGADLRQHILGQRSVVVVGGGSLGGPVALALAQAGIGSIDVIDPQVLLWGNIGRHPLGAEFVGRNKAESLAERIRRSFPHIRHVVGHPRRWEDIVRSTPTLLASADLVVCALGDWPSESALNRWDIANGRRPPVVYAWTEAHAAAGHAIAVTSAGGCLRCGFAQDGTPLLRVTKWPNDTGLRQEPGCGALFQPYGPVELQHTVALATELILDSLLGSVSSSTHRVWAASEQFVSQAGGEWTASWRERARCIGSVVESLEWGQSAICPDCNGA
jgi:molybdopterin/thiamine biosynthesis adenylyltransferase